MAIQADERTTYAESVAALRTAQKSSRGAPIYSRFVNRPLGRRFAAAAHLLGLTPNQITALSAVCTFSGIVALAVVPPSLPLGVMITVLLALGYALDSADGQLARLRGGGSVTGEWLDHVVDAIKVCSIHLAVLVAMFRFFDLPAVALMVPLVFTLQASVWFFTLMLTDQLKRATGLRLKGGGDHQGRVSLFPSLVMAPADYGLFCFIFLLLAWPLAFLAVYTALAIYNTLLLIANLVRWYRQLLTAPQTV